MATQELVLYLDFGNPSTISGTTMYDQSGKGNNCTISASGYTLQPNYMQVTNTYIGAPAPGNMITKEYTVEIYAKPTVTTSTVILMYASNGQFVCKFHLPWGDSVVYFDNYGSRISFAASFVQENLYIGVCRVTSADPATLPYSAVYVNSVRSATLSSVQPQAASVPSTTNATRILSQASNTNPWKGNIYYFKLYNYAFTQQQVTDAYLSVATIFYYADGSTSTFSGVNLTAASYTTASPMTKVVVGPFVTSLASNTFSNLTSLSTVIYTDQNNLLTAGTNVFSGITNPMNVTYYQTDSSGNLTSASASLYNGQYPANSTFSFDPNPPCFGDETTLLCWDLDAAAERYISMADLQRDKQQQKRKWLVKTLHHGYRAIQRMGYHVIRPTDKYFNRRMFVQRKTVSNGLTEDLVLTGGHGVLVDVVPEACVERNVDLFRGNPVPVVEGKQVLLVAADPSFVPAEELNKRATVRVYQLALENGGDHDARFGVCANGLWVETPSINQLQEYQLVETSEEE